MLNAIRKNGLTLALFACATTGLVAVTHFLTEDQIKQQQQAQLLSVLNQVIPADLHDNQLYEACTLVQAPELGADALLPVYIARKDGQATAMAIESIAPDGYSGNIKIITGIANDGTVLGTRVLSHQETPGLGDKIELRVSDWILSFSGKQVNGANLEQWKVRKDGGEFDQFTGATITPRAVVNAVKNAALFVNANREQLLTQPFNCGESHE